MARAQTHSHGEGTAHDDGVMQVKLLNTTRLAADKYDIHADCSSKAVIVLQSGALCPMEEETMPRAMWVDYAENCLKTRISARFSHAVHTPILVLQCKILEASVTYCHELETNSRRLRPDPRKGPGWSRRFGRHSPPGSP